MQRRKTYLDLLRRETSTGLLKEKKIKNIQKLYGDHCSVCLEQFENGDKVMITPCTHSFHEDCLMDWVNTKIRKVCEDLDTD